MLTTAHRLLTTSSAVRNRIFAVYAFLLVFNLVAWGLAHRQLRGVEPIGVDQNADGRYEVRVHQTVHDLEGKLLVDTEVRHFYTINGGLIERMDIGS